MQTRTAVSFRHIRLTLPQNCSLMRGKKRKKRKRFPYFRKNVFWNDTAAIHNALLIVVQDQTKYFFIFNWKLLVIQQLPRHRNSVTNTHARPPSVSAPATTNLPLPPPATTTTTCHHHHHHSQPPPPATTASHLQAHQTAFFWSRPQAF